MRKGMLTKVISASMTIPMILGGGIIPQSVSLAAATQKYSVEEDYTAQDASEDCAKISFADNQAFSMSDANGSSLKYSDSDKNLSGDMKVDSIATESDKVCNFKTGSEYKYEANSSDYDSEDVNTYHSVSVEPSQEYTFTYERTNPNLDEESFLHTLASKFKYSYTYGDQYFVASVYASTCKETLTVSVNNDGIIKLNATGKNIDYFEKGDEDLLCYIATDTYPAEKSTGIPYGHKEASAWVNGDLTISAQEQTYKVSSSNDIDTYNLYAPEYEGATYMDVVMSGYDKKEITYTDSNAVVKKVNNLTAQLNKNAKQIKLGWTKVSSEGYDIEYAENEDFSDAKVENSTKNNAVLTVTKDKTYYIRVRAYKKFRGEKAYGDYSNVVTVTATSDFYTQAAKEKLVNTLIAKKGYFQLADMNGDGIKDVLWGKNKNKVSGIYFIQYNAYSGVKCLSVSNGYVNVKKKTIASGDFEVYKLKRNLQKTKIANLSMVESYGNNGSTMIYFDGHKKISASKYKAIVKKYSKNVGVNMKKVSKSSLKL